MKVILFTIGSHGDVHPFVGMGMELRRRGHRVVLITNEHFKPLVERAGLQFAQVGSDEKFREMLNDPDLWHPLKGFDAVFLRGVLPTLEEGFRAVQSEYIPGETVMAASSLGFAARVAQEKLNIPTATVHIQPAVIRTVYDAPRLPGVFLPSWLPRPLKRLAWAFADKMVIDRKVAPGLNAYRATHGLPPVKGILKDWWNSPDRIIGIWPEWYAPPQPDWPKQLRLAGFPLFDENEISPLSAELDAWLRAGEAPMAFTAGSAMAQAKDFFEESTRACAQMNRRGILLSRFEDQIPKDLPPTVRHVSYAPFSTLLPRCAALVHHGGIGTTAQALQSAIPQLIMPMSHDQFDNATRITRLGVGAEIERKLYQAEQIAPLLQNLSDSPKVRENCRSVASRFAGQNGLSMAADQIESLGGAQVQQPAMFSIR